MSAKTYIRNKFLRLVQSYGGEYKILIVDDITVKIISKLVTMSDLNHHGIMNVEHLSKIREPLKISATYFLHPTFIPKLVQEDATLYHQVYLVFCETVRPEFIEMIYNSDLVKLRKIRAVTEFHMDYMALDERVFTFSGRSLDEEAEQLAGFFIAYDKYPIIRYAAGNMEALNLGQNILKILESRQYQSPNNITFLILDRSFDLITPFVQDLTYQAMVHNFIPMPDDVYTYKDGLEYKSVVLDGNDPIWTEHKHSYTGNAYGKCYQQIQRI